MQIFLTRSHYTELAIGAMRPRWNHNAANEPNPGLNETGWFTSHDGGGNHNGDDIVAISFRGNAGYACIVRGSRTWNGDWGNTVYLRCFLEDGNDCLPALEELADELSNAVFTGETPEGWGFVKEEEVPSGHLEVMNKIKGVLSGLFGQGGDFFA